jgi:hypothetical protein
LDCSAIGGGGEEKERRRRGGGGEEGGGGGGEEEEEKGRSRAYWGMDVYLHPFLSSALVGGEF